jgi:hypothetical protein
VANGNFTCVRCRLDLHIRTPFASYMPTQEKRIYETRFVCINPSLGHA